MCSLTSIVLLMFSSSVAVLVCGFVSYFSVKLIVCNQMLHCARYLDLIVLPLYVLCVILSYISDNIMCCFVEIVYFHHKGSWIYL